MRIDQNFLFERTGATPDQLLHDAVLHTASVIAVILLVATAIAMGLAARRTRNTFPILPLAILTAVIAFLLTPGSAFLWNHAPEAALLQFPWRLLAVLGPVLALGIVRLLSSDRLGASSIAERPVGRDTLARRIVVVVALAALTIPAYHVFRQPCDPEDTAPARLALFHSNAGTDPTDEYTPTGVDNDALAPGDPPYWLADSAEATAPAGSSPGPAPMRFVVMAPRAERLILNLRAYPAWRISRDGVFVAPANTKTGRMVSLLFLCPPVGRGSTSAMRRPSTRRLAMLLAPLRLFCSGSCCAEGVWSKCEEQIQRFWLRQNDGV